jgi:hypothetical protein
LIFVGGVDCGGFGGRAGAQLPAKQKRVPDKLWLRINENELGVWLKRKKVGVARARQSKAATTKSKKNTTRKSFCHPHPENLLVFYGKPPSNPPLLALSLPLCLFFSRSSFLSLRPRRVPVTFFDL